MFKNSRTLLLRVHYGCSFNTQINIRQAIFHCRLSNVYVSKIMSRNRYFWSISLLLSDFFFFPSRATFVMGILLHRKKQDQRSYPEATSSNPASFGYLFAEMKRSGVICWRQAPCPTAPDGRSKGRSCRLRCRPCPRLPWRSSFRCTARRIAPRWAR